LTPPHPPPVWLSFLRSLAVHGRKGRSRRDKRAAPFFFSTADRALTLKLLGEPEKNDAALVVTRQGGWGWGSRRRG